MRALVVKQPGPRTTVEDLGRRGVARFGVPSGGAFDPLALRAANRLVGNADEAAGLELTLLGPTLENAGDETIDVALVGARAGGTIVCGNDSSPLAPDRSAALAPGARLRLSAPLRSARAWLAIAGGVEVPLVLGSRSTYAPGGFGGFEGRPLRAGDRLPIGTPCSTRASGWSDPAADEGAEVSLAIVAGPQAGSFGRDPIGGLCAIRWQVRPTSDRTGVRLAPADGETAPDFGAPPGIPPEGTTLGAIQVPPDGLPILLGPDRPITGGYAKPAVVARAHIGRVARLRPGDALRFHAIDLAGALALDRARRTALPAAPTTGGRSR